MFQARVTGRRKSSGRAASTRTRAVTKEHATLLFRAGVKQLTAAMDVLDTMKEQQRKRRYVAPWVKQAAMQVRCTSSN